ncbi:uncharacterized protein BT62DRAFT_1014034 [Guyanagaster necrorhizus]|uniref:Uncharacterized protein n=1 Tax=Guyanagaster necrorhizus TaxID=856835 RepID=A0A9P7VER4_9AGAR|nr:uncharacterized protein BT62DRAFT_1014034 [Guyanagaster necrorhizus MCA 3950]KAG7439359.1 hypothetical protein BT62DRAFT_1014034 [Guyanagaster necrorhizus MCA 3950]
MNQSPAADELQSSAPSSHYTKTSVPRPYLQTKRHSYSKPRPAPYLGRRELNKKQKNHIRSKREEGDGKNELTYQTCCAKKSFIFRREGGGGNCFLNVIKGVSTASSQTKNNTQGTIATDELPKRQLKKTVQPAFKKFFVAVSCHAKQKQIDLKKLNRCGGLRMKIMKGTIAEKPRSQKKHTDLRGTDLKKQRDYEGHAMFKTFSCTVQILKSRSLRHPQD